MPVSLMPLPYEPDALAPAISADTLEVHHGKHHRAYVDKTNAAVAGTPLAEAPLEEIVRSTRESDRKVFNNAAQAWNHGFYWASLSPRRSSPSGDLQARIESDFGGLDKLTAELAQRGADHFASGWVWLALVDRRLTVVETHDADTLAASATLPLLVIDLWEHAYYLDRKNLRPDYLRATIDNLLNWDFAAENLARGSAWVYPA
ncbi:MAG TPA: superoxide dismutase [Novosphingobium sp.]